MKLDIYYVDAFSHKTFEGNPAAVIFSNLNDDNLMQNIAAENNLSETAFVNVTENENIIRWFSPTKEVDRVGTGDFSISFCLYN